MNNPEKILKRYDLLRKLIFYVNLILILGIITAGCNEYNKTKKEQITIKEIPEIEVIYSIGSNWIGWHKTLRIMNNGTVILEEQAPFGNNKTIKSIKLNTEEIQEFKLLINNSDVFGFKDIYDCISNCPTDLPTSNIRFIINGVEKEISFYGNQDIPEKIKEIIEKIRNIEEKFR